MRTFLAVAAIAAAAQAIGLDHEGIVGGANIRRTRTRTSTRRAPSRRPRPTVPMPAKPAPIEEADEPVEAAPVAAPAPVEAAPAPAPAPAKRAEPVVQTKQRRKRFSVADILGRRGAAPAYNDYEEDYEEETEYGPLYSIESNYEEPKKIKQVKPKYDVPKYNYAPKFGQVKYDRCDLVSCPMVSEAQCAYVPEVVEKKYEHKTSCRAPSYMTSPYANVTNDRCLDGLTMPAWY